MISLRVSSELKSNKNTSGILYVTYFELEGKSLVKVGVTTRTIEERTTQILLDIFRVYREFPYARPKRFRKIDQVYEKESQLLDFLKPYRYTPKHKFGGYTEFHEAPLELVVAAYENLLEGLPLDACRQEQSAEA